MPVRKIEILYCVSVVFAFTLLFFANSEELGLGKVFYIPCLTALLISPYLPKVNSRFNMILNLYALLTLISVFINPISNEPILSMGVVRFLFGILCFRKIQVVNPKIIVNLLAIISPIIVALHFLIINPFKIYRFAGFYGDPNYLAISFIIIILISILYIEIGTYRIFKISCVFSILGSIVLIILGISRAGIIGLGAFLFFYFLYLIIYKKKIAVFIFALSFILSGTVLTFFSDNIDNVVYRFSAANPGDKSAALSRFEEIDSGLNIIRSSPVNLLFGIGLGNTGTAKIDYSFYGYYNKHGIHNSFVKVLIEQGVFSFVLFCYMFFLLYRKIWKGDSIYKLIFLGFLLAVTIISATVAVTYFLPFFVFLFFLGSNINKITNG